jgi:UDP:flavonoid glycosyltransferase YjiC (YdhE family)
MRFLFTTFEGGGHVPPLLVVAGELRRRGHAVRVVSDQANRATVAAAGLEFDAWRRAPNRRLAAQPNDPLQDWRSRWPAAVVRALCEGVICRPAAAYAADTLAMLGEFEPDLVVSNELLFGVHAATEAAGRPLALPMRPSPLSATRRATQFSSSRTLPGHGLATSAATRSGASCTDSRPKRAA